MKEAGLTRAQMAAAEKREPANDDGLLDPPSPAVPRRHAPANDNSADHDLPSCLAVTDEEVILLHRYLSREILGLFC